MPMPLLAGPFPPPEVMVLLAKACHDMTPHSVDPACTRPMERRGAEYRLRTKLASQAIRHVQNECGHTQAAPTQVQSIDHTNLQRIDGFRVWDHGRGRLQLSLPRIDCPPFLRRPLCLLCPKHQRHWVFRHVPMAMIDCALERWLSMAYIRIKTHRVRHPWGLT
jgi:hypothetical protein